MYSDMEPCDHWEEHKQKARKVHTCSDCLATIQRGEIYTAVKGIDNGEWFRLKECSACNEFKSWLGKHVNDFKYGIAEFPEACLEIITEEFSYNKKVLNRCLAYLNKYNSNRDRYFSERGRVYRNWDLSGLAEKIEEVTSIEHGPGCCKCDRTPVGAHGLCYDCHLEAFE